MMLFNFTERDKAISFVDSMNEDPALPATAEVLTCMADDIQVRIKMLTEITKQEIQYVIDMAEVFCNGKFEVMR